VAFVVGYGTELKPSIPDDHETPIDRLYTGDGDEADDCTVTLLPVPENEVEFRIGKGADVLGMTWLQIDAKTPDRSPVPVSNSDVDELLFLYGAMLESTPDKVPVGSPEVYVAFRKV
jgi:hypothetical protein